MEIDIVSGRSIIPATINSFSVQQIPVYWRLLEFLSGNLASFPLDVHDSGSKSDEKHPLDRILKRKANQEQTSHAVLKTWYYHGEHFGNGYSYIRRDPTTNEVIGLYNLLPVDTIPYRLIPENGSLFDSTIWYWHGPSHVAFPSSDILHYRPQISYDGLVGYSPSQMFQPIASRSQMLEVYQTKFLRKGTMVRGSIELPQGTTKEQALEIIDTMKKYRASTGDNDVIILSGGAKLTNTTITPVDSQLLEQDSALTKKWCQIMGVDPSFSYEFGEQKYNAASVEAAGQNVVRFTFRPRIELLEAELTTKLLTEDEQDQGLCLRFDTSALIRGDTAVESTIAAQLVAGGLLTRNEARAQIDEPRVDDPKADQLLVPTHVASESESTSQSESETHSAQTPVDVFDALQPLLDDAAARVESKTTKAFATAQKKTEGERTPYLNALAESQGAYVAEAFGPVAQVLSKIGKHIDVPRIAADYSAEIRKRAAGQEPKPLNIIVGEHIHEA